MSKVESPNATNRNERVSRLAHFLIVSAMMACLITSMVQVGELIFPEWNGAYLVVYCFLVSLEAMYSQRMSRFLSFPDLEWWLYRGTEWIMLLVLLKALTYLGHPPGRFAIDVKLWQEDFWLGFFTGEYLFAVLAMSLVCVFSTRFSAELLALEADERALLIEQETGIYEQRETVRSRLVDMFLSIGVAMILLVTMMRSEAIAEWMNLAPLRAGVFNLLAYFLFGLVLLSMTQFNLMRSRWLLDRLPVSKEIASRWFVYSFILILAVVLLAILLPTQYSVGLLGALNYALMGLISVLNFLLWLLMLPILLLINLLMRIFGASESTNSAMPMSEIAPLLNPRETTPLPWLEILRSILFWTVFLGAIGFSLYYFLRERGDIFETLRRIPFLERIGRGIGALWAWLRGWVAGMNRQIGQAMDTGLQRLRARLFRKQDGLPWQFLGLRRLSPRQRVLFYYLAMVRRGEETGLQRKPAQTPYEYSRDVFDALQEDLSYQQDLMSEGEVVVGFTAPTEATQAVSALTERFVEARYSEHPVSEEQAGLVKSYWERVRRALRRSYRKVLRVGEREGSIKESER